MARQQPDGQKCFHGEPPQVGKPPKETPCRGRLRDGHDGATNATHQRIIGTRAVRRIANPDPCKPCDARRFAQDPFSGCDALGLDPGWSGSPGNNCGKCGQEVFQYSQRKPKP